MQTLNEMLVQNPKEISDTLIKSTLKENKVKFQGLIQTECALFQNLKGTKAAAAKKEANKSSGSSGKA